MQELDFHAYLEKYEDQILAKVLLAWRLVGQDAIRDAFQEKQKMAASDHCKLGQLLIKKRLLQITDYTKAMAVARQQAQLLYEKSKQDGAAGKQDGAAGKQDGAAGEGLTTRRRPMQANEIAEQPKQTATNPAISPTLRCRPNAPDTARQPQPAQPVKARETKILKPPQPAISPTVREKQPPAAAVPVPAPLPPPKAQGVSAGAATLEQLPAKQESNKECQLGSRFGGYEVINEVARGGMGIVYKAKQVSLNRVVALKVLLAGGAASEIEIQRFRREAEAAGALQHPNIVSIYEIGQFESYHYFTMDFIEGETMQTLIKKRSSKRKKMVQILEKVARALQYAHERGVVHRDIKPSNILVSAEGEPKLTDFGLAKKLDTTTVLTESGATLGTPFYMAPEQTLGSKDVDGRVDIYAMGVILYEVLAGRLPFNAGTLVDLYHKIVEEDPIPPSKVNVKSDKDLEVICLKAMEKDPQRRYQAAKEMADDLNHYLNGEPITAQRSSFHYRLLRKAKRYKQKLTIIGGVALLLLSLVVFVVLKNTHGSSDDQRKLAEAKLLVEEGQTLVNNGKFMEGMAKWEQATQISPSYKIPYKLRGDIYQKRQEYLSAIAEYDRLAQIVPQDPEIYCKKGECYLGLKEWDKAVQYLTQAIQLNPRYVAAYEKRGNAYHQRSQHRQDNEEDLKKAISDFKEAEALKKKQPK
jgi:serine/threonine protein kinase